MSIRYYTTFDAAAVPGDYALEHADTVITTDSVGAQATALALFAKSAGVWYVEWVLFGEVWDGGGARVGLCASPTAPAGRLGSSGAVAATGYDVSGTVYSVGTNAATAPAWGKGDVIGMLVDANTKRVVFFKNGVAVADVAMASTSLVVPPARPAASIWQGANGGNGAKVSMLLSAGHRRFEYLPQNTAGQGDWSNLPNYGWFDVVPGLGMFRVADRDWISGPDDMPANAIYSGDIAGNGPVLTDGLTFWPWSSGRASGGRATLKLHNADGAYDALVAGDVRDAEVVLRLGDTEGMIEDAEPVARLRVDSVQATDAGSLQISMTDASDRLQVALQQRLILPTADESAASRPWPWGVGALRSAELINVRAADRIYAVNDGPIAGIGQVRDRGNPFDPSLGDYTLDNAAGTMQLASEAQGRVTMDFSTVGGDLPAPPPDKLGGIGQFSSSTGWVLGGGWTVSGGALRFNRNSGSGPMISARTSASVLLAGRVYRVKLDVSKLYDHYWGQQVQPPPNVAFITVAGDNGQGKPDTTATWGAVYPQDSSGLKDLGTLSFIGTARRAGPLHLCIWPGVLGATAVLDNAVLWEVAQEQLDDDALVPALLADAMTALLEGRAGLRSSDWSRADAEAIDSATGYAGIGYFARSDASPTVADALTEMVDSVGAAWWIDDAGRIRVTQLVDPAGLDATAVIDSAVWRSELTVSLDLAPGLTTQMQGRRNWSPLAASEMVSDDLGLMRAISGGVE